MRLLKRIVLVVGLLLLAWLGVIASGWLPRPLPGDLEAIAALLAEQSQVSGERNAFAALYLFGYDVPESEWEAVAAAEVEAFARHPPYREGVAEFKVLGGTDYLPITGAPSNHPALCGPWLPDCLPRVRANLDDARELVTDNETQLARGERLAAYDYHHYLMKPRADAPIGVGVGTYLGLVLTAAALDHIDGDSDAAFARLCRATATWRRLRARTDVLIVDMLGAAQMTGATRLYAELLAEMPADFEAPCVETFAPLRDEELNQCASLRFEFLSLENSLRDIPVADLLSMFGGQAGPPKRWIAKLVNVDHSIRISARHLGPYCQPVHRERAMARSPGPLPPVEVCTTAAWLFDPAGCALSADALPNYETYYRRVLDLDGRLRMLASVLWLRAQSAEESAGDSRTPPEVHGVQGLAAPEAMDPSRAFAGRPAELQSPQHEITLDSATGTLRMRSLERGRGEFWELPWRGAVAPPSDPMAEKAPAE